MPPDSRPSSGARADAAAPARYRIFISSPGDVRTERALAAEVVEALQDEWAGRVMIEPYLWESRPLDAGSAFQVQIPPTTDFDLVVVVLWTRLGTPLPTDGAGKEANAAGGEAPRPTGTQLELEQALEGFEAQGRPRVLIYRKQDTPVFSAKDPDELDRQAAAYRHLLNYLDGFLGGRGQAFKRAFHEFQGPVEFASKFRGHLAEKLREEFQTENERSRAWQDCPYRGLEVFEADHARIFRGRTADTLAVVARLQERVESGCSFLLISGASGVGKSSLIRAGVRRFLTRKDLIPEASEWRVALLRPSDAGHDLGRGIVQALRREEALGEHFAPGLTESALVERFEASPTSLENEVRAALNRMDDARASETGEDERAHLLLLIDQLEEVLADAARPHVSALARALDSLCRHDECRVWVVATVRSDLRHRFESDPILGPLSAGQGTFELPPPSPAQLREIIEAPGLTAGATFEERDGRSLVERIQEDAVALDRSLPLLQFALQQLWERDVESAHGDSRLLTWEGYESLGRSEGAEAEGASSAGSPLERALTVHADRCLAQVRQVDSAAADCLGDVLFHLLRVEQGVTLRARLDAEVLNGLSAAARRLVEHLERGRLLVPHEDGRQLAHEALVLRWRTLRDYARGHRKLLESHSRIDRAAQDWHASRRDEGTPPSGDEGLLLTSDLQVAEGRALLEQHPTLSAEVTDFVSVSLERQAERLAAAEREREAGLRRTIAMLAGGIVALLIAGFLIHLTLESRRDQQRAETRGLVANALVEDSPLARRELLASIDRDVRTPGLLSAQLRALAEPVPLLELHHAGGEALDLAYAPGRDRVAALWGDGLLAAFKLDPDGELAGDVTWRRLPAGLPRGDLRWSRDGSSLTVLDAGAPHWSLTCSEGAEGSVILGPEREVRVHWGSARTASAVASASVVLWSSEHDWIVQSRLSAAPLVSGAGDTQSLQERLNAAWPSGVEGDLPVWLELSPDGASAAFAIGDRWLAWGPVDGARAWTALALPVDGEDEETPTALVWGHDGEVLGIVLDEGVPRRRVIHRDGASSWERLRSPISGDDVQLTCAARVEFLWVSGDEHGWLRTWDPDKRRVSSAWRAHAGRVRSVCVGASREWFASSGADGRVRVWRTAGGANPSLRWTAAPDSGVRDIPVDLRFSPSGDWLARLSDAPEGNLVLRLQRGAEGAQWVRAAGFQTQRAFDPRFSSDSAWLAARTSRSSSAADVRLALWALSPDGSGVDRRDLSPLPEGVLSTFALDVEGDALRVVVGRELLSCKLSELRAGGLPDWQATSGSAFEVRHGPFLSAGGETALAVGAEGQLWRWSAADDWTALGECPSEAKAPGVDWFPRPDGGGAVFVRRNGPPTALDWTTSPWKRVDLGDGGVLFAGDMDTGVDHAEATLFDTGTFVALLADRSIAAWDCGPESGVAFGAAIPMERRDEGAELISVESGAWSELGTDNAVRLWRSDDPSDPLDFPPLHSEGGGVRLAIHPAEGWLARSSNRVFLQLDRFDPDWMHAELHDSVDPRRQQSYSRQP